MEIVQQKPLIHPESLGDTLDAINAALFTSSAIPVEERTAAAAWIADRQGLPGAYAGMFAPTEFDYAFGTLTFTGEPVVSGAGTAHLLSEEACRALYLLGIDRPEIESALERARRGIFKRMEQSEVQGKWSGVYCCGTCSVALWRHMLASGTPDDMRRLENGLSELKRHRDSKGRWRRFPYYYTLLALSEIDLPGAQDEVDYLATGAERALRRLDKASANGLNVHDQRRKAVLERVLNRWG